MTRARVAAAALGLFGLGLALPLLVSGCAGGAVAGGGVSFGYSSVAGRPHPRYYCADCHGVSYFDPYYDLCMRYGYRFDWRRQPEVTAVYRRDYAAIKRADPSLGSYRYSRGAKEETRKRLADTDGKMPRYEGASPAKGQGGPPRGPKVTGPRTKEERTSPPRGKAKEERNSKGKSDSKGEKREPSRGKNGRDDGKDESGSPS